MTNTAAVYNFTKYSYNVYISSLQSHFFSEKIKKKKSYSEHITVLKALKKMIKYNAICLSQMKQNPV